MRCRIYCCKSEPCLSALTSCKFKLKTLTCERTKQSHLYQHDDHFAGSAPDLRPQRSLEMKVSIRELVAKDVKLARIRNELNVRLWLVTAWETLKTPNKMVLNKPWPLRVHRSPQKPELQYL
ncbi:hypothetical protein F441_23135, partial [Phytophthora nicotianae CJ01A1]